MNKSEKRKKYVILSSLLFLSSIGTILLLSPLKKPSGLNVILITIDALSADHLGCYGYRRETSPFLDEFSQDAFIFLNAVAQSATTGPSAGSMFTSKYPFSDCVVDSSYRLVSRYPSMAEFLKAEGYNTYAIIGHYFLGKNFGFSRGFNYFNDDFKNFRNADEMRKLAVRFLKKINQSKKFFLWLHFHEPHSPYTPPDQYRKVFSETFSGQDREKIYTICGKKCVLSNKRIQELIIAYDANIRFIDDNLRNLFQFLKQDNLIEKSIIIITADHGESLGEHNIFDHNELYYRIIRVPLIIKIPYCKGKVINYPVSLIDIFPTLLDMLGYEEQVCKLNLKGKNLFIYGKADKLQFSEYSNRKSIIKENWRIFLNKKGDYELYNIKDDPLELNNLASREIEKLESLKRRLSDLIELADHCTEKSKLILDEKAKDKLRSLGYIQ